jgi:adenylate cyclase
VGLLTDDELLRQPAMPRLNRALTLGLVTGALGLLLGFLPFGLDLEERLGLEVLFTLRGQRAAPPDVVVVSIDRASADVLQLPADATRWPRSVHARLTDNLARAGARVIVFDIFFDQARVSEDDRIFAEAIRGAGNVVLSKYLARETVTVGEPVGGSATIERLVPPVPLLAGAAVASAPFPLPKVPVRVNQYWTFKTGAGDTPTLPVVAFQVFAIDAYDELLKLLERVSPEQALRVPRDAAGVVSRPGVELAIRAMRAAVDADPRAGGRIVAAAGDASDPRARRLLALARMYQSPNSEYLNFYGPSRTIATLPYHRVISDEATADPARLGLAGKAVFIGLSEYLRPEQKDGFHTVFSEATGIDLSGVEIAATAFANLLEDRHVRPLGPAGHAALLVGVGLLLGALCTLLSPVKAAAGTLGIGVLYLATAEYQFDAAGVWYPITMPLLVQAPVAFVGAILWRYAEANRERGKMRKVFSYYLPDAVIDELMKNTGGVSASSRLVYGICLATDADRYTSLAEAIDPDALARLVNRYYAAIFEPVRRRGGTISDVEGDAMLAIWAAPLPDIGLRAHACHAACEITAAVDQFNRAAGAVQLPTRLGLHSGRMMLGHVGAIDHYEYRAVGDIVNSAARIQSLNKRFRTRILVSDDVVNGLDGFLTRRLGTFLLAGKSKPLIIHELICRKEEASDRQVRSCVLFAEGLVAYEDQSWDKAGEAFAACLTECGDDGPARFYLNSCEAYKTRPPDVAWDGVIRMETK